MDVSWTVTDADVAAIRTLLRKTRSKSLVLARQAALSNPPPDFDAELFWHRLVSSVLSSVTSSGAGGRLDVFLNANPFPLALADCKAMLRAESPQGEITEVLKNNGIRMNVTRAKHLVKNLESLEAGAWTQAQEHWAALQSAWQAKKPVALMVERDAAHWADGFAGVGPKQSRNLWQWLGLTRFEIPIDSRWMNWLRDEIDFPLPVEASLLSNRAYYELIQARIQDLATATSTSPVILDAAVFSR